MNQRIAALRGLFRFTVVTGACDRNSVPSARRSSGLRAKRRGLLGHVSTGRPCGRGRLVREQRRLPDALEPDEVAEFVSDLGSDRDRAIVLLGRLRAGEVRSLRLADVDVGTRRVRVIGKGGRNRGGHAEDLPNPPQAPSCLPLCGAGGNLNCGAEWGCSGKVQAGPRIDCILCPVSSV
jgi:integrase